METIDNYIYRFNLKADTALSGDITPADILRTVVNFNRTNRYVLKADISDNAFRAEFSGLKRRIGEKPLVFSPRQIKQLTSAGFPSAVTRPAHILGRVLLLLELSLQRQSEDIAAFIHQLFIRGDNMEQCAILCALPLLPTPAHYVKTAIQATRGYILEVFDTLINRNPYPAIYFDDIAFNQSVLKALFLGVPLQDVIGLINRINPELKRMVNAFVSERLIAGRDVPSDVNLII